MMIPSVCLFDAGSTGHFALVLAYKMIIDQADIVLTAYGISAPRAGRAEDQALLYAIGSNKPIINVDPYTLTVKLFRDNYIEFNPDSPQKILKMSSSYKNATGVERMG